MKRFVAIWFQHLKTDWMIRQDSSLQNEPFVLAIPDHGRMRITEVSALARRKGIEPGMVVADARVALPSLKVLNDDPQMAEKLLIKLGRWAVRYTPSTAVDLPDGLILDVTGCSHLWHGEANYFSEITNTLIELGYHVRAAMADTIGCAWGVARYGHSPPIIESYKQRQALKGLTPAALRLELPVLERLHKLGLYRIESFMDMDARALRRRFGSQLVNRLQQALGEKEELIQPLVPIEPFDERLPCMEPIQTRKGIEIALEKLLCSLCNILLGAGKGIRTAVFSGYRIDGHITQVAISTNRASVSTEHLLKLFEIRLNRFEPGPGVEVFSLAAKNVQKLSPIQASFWSAGNALQSGEVTRLLDYIQGKFGRETVCRYLPAGHHMPEHSMRQATNFSEKPAMPWRTEKRRPIILQKPEKILVTAPVPDYPPMNFQYKGTLHTIKKADGPERIEPEWWIAPGLHRDYYVVEDQTGCRFWLFRAGHYNSEKKPEWYLHGVFA